MCACVGIETVYFERQGDIRVLDFHRTSGFDVGQVSAKWVSFVRFYFKEHSKKSTLWFVKGNSQSIVRGPAC